MQTTTSDEIPMPMGWERKYDSAAGRTYYIDHAHRVTQWDDPRLRHPSIWREAQRQMLERLNVMFKDAPEDTIRQALIMTRFVESDTINHLSGLGYKKSTVVVVQPPPNIDHPTLTAAGSSASAASIQQRRTSAPRATSPQQVTQADMVNQVNQARKATSPKPRPSNAAAASPNRTVNRPSITEHHQQSRHQADPFTLMTMKARFPETADDVIIDVLNQCGQNVDMTSRELTNMGYAGRQKAIDKNLEQGMKADEREKDKQKKQKDDRDKNLAKLKNEFDKLLDTDVANTLETCAFDMYEARSALRRREGDIKIKALTAEDTHPVVPAMAAPAVTVQESSTDIKVPHKANLLIESTKSSIIEPTEDLLKETSILKQTKKLKSKTSNSTKTKHLTTINLIHVNENHSKSAGATPAHQIGGWKSLAKGPDPKLRRGSDTNITGRRSLAMGPDPTMRQGPNKELRQSLVIGHQVTIELAT